jgi:hypothetical protein
MTRAELGVRVREFAGERVPLPQLFQLVHPQTRHPRTGSLLYCSDPSVRNPACLTIVVGPCARA